MDSQKNNLKLSRINGNSLKGMAIGNRYLILEKRIGGSFGQIYKAMDVGHNAKYKGREVVVKLLCKWKIRQSINPRALK